MVGGIVMVMVVLMVVVVGVSSDTQEGSEEDAELQRGLQSGFWGEGRRRCSNGALNSMSMNCAYGLGRGRFLFTMRQVCKIGYNVR